MALMGITTAGGWVGWLLEPFLATTGKKFKGVEWYVLPDFPHPSQFSRSLIAMLSEINTPVFLWSCVDMFIDREVEAGPLDSLAQYMVEKGNIVRMGLSAVHWPYEVVDEWGDLNIVRCADVTQCSIQAGTAFDACLFDRCNLLKVLEPRWSIWQAEVWATEKMLKHPTFVSRAVYPGLFNRVDVSCQEGWFWHLDQLTEEDRAEVLKAAPGGIEWRK